MKRQRRTRLLSWILALCMVLSMLPTTALAASEPTDADLRWVTGKVNELNMGIEPPYSSGGWHSFGKDSDLYYNVYTRYIGGATPVFDALVFVVPGNGANKENCAMPDFEALPEYWSRVSPSQIFIGAGVTGIGSNAFVGMDTVDRVTFQDASDLTYIGENAFSGVSGAQFVDEGNVDNSDTLNLSNVERLGSYAFSGCSGLTGVTLGNNITAVEEDAKTPNKIPQRAFSGTRLTTITVPEGITVIGEGAFAGNVNAGSISLPDSLETIDDYAFACSIDGNNRNVTELTIPENVTSIGVNAFYGFRGMKTLTVESEVLNTVKNGAFGTNALSAYHGNQTITGPDGTTTTVTMGTVIKTPNQKVADLFDTGINCYTGPVSPLTLTDYKPAECDEDGWRIYSYEFNNESKTLRETLPRLGIHYNYRPREIVSATCTEAAYYQYACDRHYEETTDGEWISVEHTHNVEIRSDQEGYKLATGHNYQVTAISDGGEITEAGGSRVTFTCQNKWHNPNHAQLKETNILLQADAVSGETKQTLEDVDLPDVDGGTLKWDTPNTVLTYNNDQVQYYNVIFTPDPNTYSYLVDKDKNPVTASSVEGTHLKVGVQVVCQELDFSQIAFGGASNLVMENGEPVRITVSGAPTEGISDPKILYYNDTYNSEKPPSRKNPWTGTVSVTYTYDASVYSVDPGTEFVYGTPELPYLMTVDESGTSGTVTITHRYEIVYGDWDIVEAMALNRTYGDSAKETVRLLRVPTGTEIAWSYEGINGTTGSGTGADKMEGTGNSIDIAPIENAGDYRVSITLTNSSYGKPLTLSRDVHVNKKPVALPTAVRGLMYDGTTQTGVADPGADALYTIEGNTGMNADQYTAKATLTEAAFANHCWRDLGEDVPFVEIPWSIAQRPVQMPTISTAVRSYIYNGGYREHVTLPATGYTYEREETTIQGKLEGTNVLAFTVSEGRAKDVGSYTVTAALASDNFYWTGTGAPENGVLELPFTNPSWSITAASLGLPAWSLAPVTYNGTPYEAPGDAVSGLTAALNEGMLGGDTATFNGYSYSGADPNHTNAGTYTVTANYTYLANNYVIRTGSLSTQVTIEQAMLTLTAPPAEQLTVSYSANGNLVPEPTISGYPAQGVQDATLLYRCTSIDGVEQEQPEWGTRPTFHTPGTYVVEVKVNDSGTNYKSKVCQYKFTITAAGQTITLTKDGGTVLAGSTVKTSLDNTITVTGDSNGGGDISYEVTTNPDVVSVDQNGTVTPLKVGEATITVTAAAVKDPQSDIVMIQGTSVSYTVDVTKGTPTIHTDGIQTVYTYNGSAIPEGSDGVTGYKKATVSGPRAGAATPDQGKLQYYFYNHDETYATEEEVLNASPESALATAPSAPGSYWLKVTYPGDDNYVENSEVVKITINEASVGDITASYIETYDGQAHDLAEIVKKIVAEKAITGATVQVMKSTEQPNAETQGWNTKLTVKNVADSTNTNGNCYWYKVTAPGYGTAIGEITVNITPKEVTIEGTPETTKTYDGELNIDQSNVAFTVETGFENESFSVSATGAFASKTAEPNKPLTITYTLKPADGTVIGNYTFTNGTLTANVDGTGTVTQTATGEITKASITVTGGVAAQNKDYDGTTNVALMPTTDGIKFEGKQGTDDISVVLNTAGAQGRTDDADVDDNKAVTGIDKDDFVLDGTDAGNYEITGVSDSLNVTVNIMPRPITLDWPKDMSFPYRPGGLTVADYGLVPATGSLDFVEGEEALAADEIGYTFMQNGTSVATPEAVGTYGASATLAEDIKEKFSNYDIQLPSPTMLEITSATTTGVTVTPTGDPLTYNGNTQSLFTGVTVALDGSTLSEGDYKIVYSLNATVGSASETIPTGKDARTYTVYYWVTPDNYNPVPGSFVITIDRADLTITRTLNGTKIYDGGTKLEENQLTVVQVSGAVNNEQIQVEVTSSTYDSKDAGDPSINITYTLTATNCDLRNYRVQVTNEGAFTDISGNEPMPTAEISETADGEITRKTVTIMPNGDNLTKVYGESDPTIIGFTAEGLVGEDKVGGVLSRDSGENVGSYALSLEQLTVSTNYTLQLAENAPKFSITAKDIRVTIPNGSSFYGEDPDLSGLTPTVPEGSLAFQDDVDDLAITLTPKTAVEGDEVTAETDVGDTYVIIGESTNPNYRIAYINGAYEVKARPITITVKNQESFYGAATLADLTYEAAPTAGNELTGAAILAGDGLTIGLATNAQAGSDAKEYTITITGASGADAQNYDITWANEDGSSDKNFAKITGTYTVKPAALGAAYEEGVVNGSVGRTVNNDLIYTNTSIAETLPGEPEGVTVIYSVADPAVAEVDPVTGAVTPIATGNTTVTATISAGTNTNYTADSVQATYTLHVSAGSTELDVWGVTGLTYNGREHTLVQVSNPNGISITYTVTKDGKPVTTVNADGLPAAAGAGTYHIVWEAAGSDDYLEDHGRFDVVIAKADLTGGFENPGTIPFAYAENAVYGYSNNPFTLPNDYSGTVSLFSSRQDIANFTNRDPKTYQLAIYQNGETTITAYCEEDENYNGSTFSFTLAVSEASDIITVKAVGYTGIYDGAYHDAIAEREITAPQNHVVRYSLDDKTYSTTMPQFKDAGKYTVYYEVTAPGCVDARGTVQVDIEKRTITESMIRGVEDSYDYSGSSIEPNVFVVYGDEVLPETDYTVTYGKNVSGTGTVTVKVKEDCKNFTDSCTVTFSIEAKDTSYLSAELDSYFGYADGNEADRTATLTVTFNGIPLEYGTDYTAACSGGTNHGDGSFTFETPGTYTITVTPTDAAEFTGKDIILTYTLLPAEDGTLNLNDGESGIYTYGDRIDGSVTVTDADGVLVDEAEYKLTYHYYPNVGTEDDGNYDPEATLGEAGLYVVTATGLPADDMTGATGIYNGAAGTFVFLIKQRDLSEMNITVNDAEYTGEAVYPDVYVSGLGDPSKGTDYTVDYLNNVDAGTGYARITAKGNNFVGMALQKFSIEEKTLERSFKVDPIPSQPYQGGKEIKPDVVVWDAETGEALTATDYTVSYENNRAVGTATAIVTGIGNYSGTIRQNFQIYATGGETYDLDLTIGRTSWTYNDTPQAGSITVTYDEQALEINSDYTLTITHNGETTTYRSTKDAIRAMVNPGTYVVTAVSVSEPTLSDSETVTIHKVQTDVSITADPTSMTGSGTVTLTISGSGLPAGTDLTQLVNQTGGDSVDLSSWSSQGDGTYKATFAAPNSTEDYTFTIRFNGDAYYDGSKDRVTIYVTRYSSGGGSGGGGGSSGGGGSKPADPDVEDPSDTGVSNWLNTRDHIAYLSGYPGGGFGPDNSMTRAEVAQMFYALLNDKNVTITTTFPDVPENAWYATAVNTLASLGMVSGDANGNYRPNDPITRAEFCVIALAFAYEPENASCSFYDVFRSDWFYPYVAQAASYGWIGGYTDNTFGPNDNITRAQVTTIVNNMLGRTADQDYVDDNLRRLNTFLDVPRAHWAYYQIMEAANTHDYTKNNGIESWR